MAAGTTIYTKTLDRVLAVAKSIAAIGNSRAFQGYKRFADGDNLEASIAALTAETQAYFFCVLDDLAVKENDAPGFTILGELIVSTPKDTTSDLNAAYDVAVSLATELKKRSNFIEFSNELALPGEVRFRKHKTDIMGSAGLTYFDFGRYGFGGIEFIDP